MLKCDGFITLDSTLKLLGVKSNNHFNEKSPLGYHKTTNAAELSEWAISHNLCVNRLSENEIIISTESMPLGRHINTVENGKCIRTYYSMDDWKNIKSAYENISHISAIPKMSFPAEKVVISDFVDGETLLTSKSRTGLIKDKLLDFIKSMNSAGYVHRDLHCKNIIVSESNLFVIDWDFVARQKCKLLDSYDVTARGLPSPHLTNMCHIFRSFPIIGVPSVARLLNISMNDLSKVGNE